MQALAHLDCRHFSDTGRHPVAAALAVARRLGSHHVRHIRGHLLIPVYFFFIFNDLVNSLPPLGALAQSSQ
jgi:hypothetical protein